MSTRCYLVLGPESAGNRMLCGILTASGCHGEATARHDKGYNTVLPIGESPVALVRSFPHGGEWPDLGALLGKLADNYDEVTVLVTVRHPVALLSSQVERGHVTTHIEASKNAAYACVTIMAELGKCWGLRRVDWYVVPYESMDDAGARSLMDMLDLSFPEDGLVCVDGADVRLENRNAKHFLVGAT